MIKRKEKLLKIIRIKVAGNANMKNLYLKPCVIEMYYKENIMCVITMDPVTHVNESKGIWEISDDADNTIRISSTVIINKEDEEQWKCTNGDFVYIITLI